MSNLYPIIIPCYNESEGILSFLTELDSILQKSEYNFVLLIVDDCSTDNSLELIKKFKFSSNNCSLQLISMINNVGHQEAIRQGICYISENITNFKAAIIMDGDGEDDPSAILKLVAINNFEIVFVERGKRFEDISFKIGYFLYKILFRIIIGKNITFGNFSMLSAKVVNAVVNAPFIHYASFLLKQKFKISTLKHDRRKRNHGYSKMNQKSLVLHGLYSLIEFSEDVLYFLMRTSVLFFLLDVSFGGYVLYSKYRSHTAILGWASSSMLGLISITLLLICTIILGLLIVSLKRILTQKRNHYIVH